jgi:hypothetical protein
MGHSNIYLKNPAEIGGIVKPGLFCHRNNPGSRSKQQLFDLLEAQTVKAILL